MRSHFRSFAVMILSLAMVWLCADCAFLNAQKAGMSRGGASMSRGGSSMSRGGGGMSRSFSRPSGMSRSYGGGSSYSRNFSSPSNFSRSYRAPSNYSRSFNSTSNFSRSYKAPGNYSRTFNSPSSYSRNFNAPSSYSRNFSSPGNYSRSISPSHVTNSYGTRGHNSRSFAFPGNSSLNTSSSGNIPRNSAAGNLSRSFDAPRNVTRGFNYSNTPGSIVPSGLSHRSPTPSKATIKNGQNPANISRAGRGSAGNANSFGTTPLRYDNLSNRNKYEMPATGGNKIASDARRHPSNHQPGHHPPHHKYHKYNKHHHHHGHKYSHFYFCPYGFGFNYFGSGFGLSFGWPFYGYRGFYSGPSYCGAYLAQPYYNYYAVSSVPVVIEAAPLEPGLEEIPVEPPIENEIAEPVSVPAAGQRDGAIIAADGHAAEFQKLAEDAFREQRYEDAARLVSHAIIEDGSNGKLHLFASQTFFALGEYRAAAAAIQRAAAQLDRDDWGFVVENFKKFYTGRDYVTQMEDLVKFDKENPDESYASFLRGYHYNYLGYKESAQKQLLQAVKLESRDKLAAELLIMAGGTLPKKTSSDQPIVLPEKPAADQDSDENETPGSELID